MPDTPRRFSPEEPLGSLVEFALEVAAQAGCHYPVVRSQEDFVAKVREVTDGEGAAVVYEAIGKDTLQQSLDCLRLMGVCAAYGHVSGPPDPVDIIQDLGRRGSLFITRPAIMHYVAKRSDLEWTARDLFNKSMALGLERARSSTRRTSAKLISEPR